jgi:uncharacterized protein YqeY
LGLRDRLRRALADAIRSRDPVVVAALRSALGAIDNAEAPDLSQAPGPGVSHPRLAGTVAGLGAGEVDRRRLTEANIEDIVRTEIADRAAAARDYHRAGRADRAERLRREAEILASHLDRHAG